MYFNVVGGIIDKQGNSRQGKIILYALYYTIKLVYYNNLFTTRKDVITSMKTQPVISKKCHVVFIMPGAFYITEVQWIETE